MGLGKDILEIDVILSLTLKGPGLELGGLGYNNFIEQISMAESTPVIQEGLGAEARTFDINIACLVDGCNYVTQMCQEEATALILLKMHMTVVHAQDLGDKPQKASHKLWIPEILDLNPSEGDGEAYLFWKSRFDSYIQECGIEDCDAKYLKLKSRISFKIFQHGMDACNYDDLVNALKELYAIKQNRNPARNNLITTRQQGGESIKNYLLKLQGLARHYEFTRPETIDENQNEWLVQAFIAGLSSRDMRLNILEKEEIKLDEVFKHPELLERMLNEAILFDASRIQNMKLGAGMMNINSQQQVNNHAENNSNEEEEFAAVGQKRAR